jgi:hypothetical protein
VQNYFTQNFSSREISTVPASLFLAVILAVLAGCGSGGMNSNPVTTGTKGQIALFAASQTTVGAGQSSILTVNVTDGTAPLSSQTVTFSLLKSGSGAPTLSAASVTTDGRGNAITIYSPGTASPTTSVEDIVQASLANGSTAVVSITRSSTTVASTGIAVLATLSASQTTVSAGQSSIITAKVTDGAGAPVSGQTVTFSMVKSGSGVPALSAASATTDGLGNAITIYSPGAASPTASVEDIVQASITSGSTRAVSIIRSSTTVASTATAVLATLSASQTTVTANQSSIITAKVTNSAGDPISGETVKFTLPVTGSGAPTLSAASVVTDGSGNAVTIYTPGVGSPTDTVNDAIQATLTNGSTQAVIVTRSNQAATANTVALTSSCGGIITASNSCVVTATVKNASGSAVSGIPVTFTIAVSGTGAPTLLPAAGTAVTTDGNGNAITIYTAGATAKKTDVITAAITGGNAAIVMAD